MRRPTSPAKTFHCGDSFLHVTHLPAYKIYVPPLPHFANDGSNVSGNMAAAELSAIYRAMQKSAARFSNYNVRE